MDGQLIDAKINPFCRVIWKNKAARSTWEPVIHELAALVSGLELLSVKHNQRDCATITSNKEDIFSLNDRYPDLIFTPIRYVKKFSGFAHFHGNPEPGEDFFIHYVASKSKAHGMEFKAAYDSADHDKQGRLLGFPECCREFFIETWGRGIIDPIAEMEMPNKAPHPFSNPLLRYLGIRVCFHIPHSFNCQATVDISEERIKLIDDDNKKTLLKAMLSMPMSWSCLHGAAEVRTPIFWIITSSCFYKERHTVTVEGDFIPKE